MEGRDTHGRFGSGNPFQWPQGVSGNPGGRAKSKILSEAARLKLETDVPGDPLKRTWAEAIIDGLALAAMAANVPAVTELRKMTEGDRIVLTLEDQVIMLLRQRKVTPDDVRKELPDDAERLIIAAGLAGAASPPTEE